MFLNLLFIIFNLLFTYFVYTMLEIIAYIQEHLKKKSRKNPVSRPERY